MSEHDDRLRELGTQLPWDRPDGVRRDAVRSALLVAAAEGTASRRPSTRWYVIGGAFAAGALAAAAAVLLFVRGGDKPAPIASAAQITASPASQFERSVTRTPTGVDEVVRLKAGTLTMAVGALRVGDHVRVATRDGEVEGEGSYNVVVVADALEAVKVSEGHATIRVAGQQAVFLSSGQSWQARAIVAHEELAKADDVAPPIVAPAPEPAPAVVAPAPAVVETPTPIARSVTKRPVERHEVPAVETKPDTVEAQPATAATEPEPTAPPVAQPSVAPVTTVGPKDVERHFQAGMALLKAGKAAEAARELNAAADAGGDDPLAADARYFAAAALTKAGRKTEAERALVAFINRAPTSIRRGRAAVMLARLIAERGDRASARAWFESALGDADASVVAAARAGLAALH